MYCSLPSHGTDMKPEQVYAALDSLLDYAKNCELLHPLDETFARNSLLAELKLESYEKQPEHYNFPDCLNLLCDYAAETGLIHDTIAERDLFDTRLMGCVTPRPSEVVRKFWSLYAESPTTATDYFYKLSQDCNYIRRDRIAKDERWTAETKYGMSTGFPTRSTASWKFPSTSRSRRKTPEILRRQS